ncbi:hypothetical protein ACFWZW_11565 [Microbacterium enclense]|uniref:hypothetical protein n=1 Tax=Microbacterium enclense TaxID=993073 RepID=UPI001FA167E6|nr:hypothetical protein [Actinomycetota bacterium]
MSDSTPVPTDPTAPGVPGAPAEPVAPNPVEPTAPNPVEPTVPLPPEPSPEPVGAFADGDGDAVSSDELQADNAVEEDMIDAVDPGGRPD